VPAFDQIIKVSNASLTSIRSISPAIQKLIILINGTGSTIAIKNQDAGATAANRIITGSGIDLSLRTDQSIVFSYDDNSTRWRISGGAGGGGGLQPTFVSAGPVTAQAGFNYLTDTTLAGFTLTLPAGATGSTIRITDATETWALNNLTVVPAAGQKIDMLANDETLVCDVVRGWVELNWTGTYWAFNSLASTQAGEASATAAGIVSTGTQSFAGNKTFLGSITPTGGIVGKTDAAAIGTGLHGEVITVANNTVFAAGVAYRDSSTTVLTGSLAVVLSRVVNKGLYLMAYVSTLAISGAASLQGRLRIQATGTAITPDLFNQSASGGVCISQPSIPVRIDTDGTIIEVLLAMGGGPATCVHDLYIVRLA
jgi:hypothetical protein